MSASTLITNLNAQQAKARSLRRLAPTAITHSGGRQTVFSCICGARHTTSTDWNGRHAKHVLDWRATHDKQCAPIWERTCNSMAPGWVRNMADVIYSNDDH